MISKTERVIAIIVALFAFICIVISVKPHCRVKKTVESYRKDSSDPMLTELKRRMQPLFEYPPLTGLLEPLTRQKLDHVVLKEDNEEAYTLNKKEIFMCLYDEKGKYYHVNNLLFVLAHEIAHSICPEEGHTQLWNDTFNELLNEMIKRGIYNENIPMIENYCGLDEKK